MTAILISFVVLGIVLGTLFAVFFRQEQRNSRALIDAKTDATDRMARLAHHLEVNNRKQPQA